MKKDILTEVPPQKQEWKIGDELINRFEIVDIKGGKGKSGMGIVYVALDHEWNKMFAIKTFQPHYLWDEDVINRFMNEAERWTKLGRHTNIVFANFVNKIEGIPCIFLEYIDGGDLSKWIGRLDIPQILDYAIQFCNGMDYAHKKLGLIHRDIKPQNVLLTNEGVLKVTDFGLANIIKEISQKEGLGVEDSTTVSRGIGTPLYMPPEQFSEEMQIEYDFSPKPVTIRSDIYSFGVTFYQLITGKLPFSTYHEIFTQNPANLATSKTNIPKQLDSLIIKCLEKSPENRYQSFAELMEELIKIYNGLPREEKIFAERYVVRGEKDLLSELDWNNKGFSLDKLSKYQEALICYDKALEINPTFVMAWINKGASLFELGRHREALICYDKALEINPRYTETWNNKGIVLHKLGKYHEAILYYDRAVEINPMFVKAWNNKGVALDKLGRYQEAITCYDKIIEINPRYAEAWNNKGLALYNSGKYQEVITCCDKALEINPRYAEAWYNEGNALNNLDESQEALICYDKAVKINPRYLEAWHNKGALQEKLERYQEAVICYDKVLEIDPRCLEAWYNKGYALGNLGKYQESILSFQKVIELDSPQYASQVEEAKEIIRQVNRILV